jgi:hypothetical protein
LTEDVLSRFGLAVQSQWPRLLLLLLLLLLQLLLRVSLAA